MARLKPYQPVVVTWHDAQGREEWTDLEDVEPELPLVTTIGLFVRETPDVVVLASCHSVTKGRVMLNGISWIPKGMLDSLKPLGKSSAV